MPVSQTTEQTIEKTIEQIIVCINATYKPYRLIQFKELFSCSSNLGKTSKKNCTFYEIWQKGRGSKDQNQISEKVLRGVGKRLQCHKIPTLIIWYFIALKQHFFVKRSQFSVSPPSPFYEILSKLTTHQGSHQVNGVF